MYILVLEGIALTECSICHCWVYDESHTFFCARARAARNKPLELVPEAPAASPEAPVASPEAIPAIVEPPAAPVVTPAADKLVELVAPTVPPAPLLPAVVEKPAKAPKAPRKRAKTARKATMHKTIKSIGPKPIKR